MTNKLEAEVLLPCPWCDGVMLLTGITPGRVATRERTQSRQRVFCNTCRAHGPTALNKQGAIAAWNRRLSAPPAGWVSVEDRLPETATWKEVLTVDLRGNVACAEYWGDEKEWWPPNGKGEHWGDRWHDYITHWMPLPAAPAAELPGGTRGRA